MKESIKKYITKETLMKIFIVFLIIQPVIDIHILFDKTVINFFGFSPSTIIRIVFVVVLLFLCFVTIKIKKKHLLILLYLLLVSIYSFFHYINALNFTSKVPGNFNYSLITELFYIIRMLMPLSIIFISYNLNFTDKKLNKVVTWLIILISGSIVLTNIFNISLGSYTSEPIQANIFQWFGNAYDKYSFYNVASKGFFTFANQISALLVLLTPLLIYIFIKKSDIKGSILLFIQLLAMFMLGTKVATFGFIYMMLLTTIIYWYFCFIKKDIKFKWRTNNTFIVLLIVCFVLLPFSPAKNRELVDDVRENDYINNENGRLDFEEKELTINDEKLIATAESIEEQLHDIDEDLQSNYGADNTLIKITDKETLVISKEKSDEILISFIEKNYQDFSIRSRFIEQSYPYKYDPYFWYNIMKEPLMKRTDYRYIESMMLERVIDINNNAGDRWLGITYSRMQNIFPLEKDFQSHYYTLGILGLTLLVIPYIIIIIICGLEIICKYKSKFTLKNVLFLLGIVVTLFAAYYSGNVIDGLVVTLILGFVIGQLVKNVFPQIKE